MTSAIWRGFGASATGTAHGERGTPCQDAHALVELPGGGLVVAVADGAGSASHSEQGAWIAVETAADAAAAAVAEGGSGPARSAVAAARRALEEAVSDGQSDSGDETEAEGASPRRLGDLACTLLVAVVTGDSVDAAQVGDGAIVVRRGGELEVLVPSAAGEFLNETCFLTSSGWTEDLRLRSATAVDAVAVMSDGLQLLALDMAAGRPHAAFFAPLLSWAAGAGPDGRDLVQLLGSEKVNARTDDDKTLALAVLVDG